MRPTKRLSFGMKAAVASAAILCVGLYACLPRKADLRNFDPAKMAALETTMWRDYYEKRYASLFYNLYLSSRVEFGFSPLDSFMIAVAAARAAKTFQPTGSRQEAEAALPSLVSYYRILARAAPASFDVEKAAKLELDWWQARREAVSPDDYGRTIAATSSMIYGKDDALVVESGIERARAMAYRDARGQAMSDANWSEIASMLLKAYTKLQRGVKPDAS